MVLKKKMSGMYNAAYLKRLIKPSEEIKFAKKGNFPIAIICTKGASRFLNNGRIAFEEEVKIPLYKQAMDLQMGKIPRQTRTDRRCYNLRFLKEEEITGLRFEVYAAIV